MVAFQRVTTAFRRLHDGVLEKKDWFPKVSYFALYFLLSSFFAVHLYFLISEHLTNMFIDITSYKNLEDHSPDVAICVPRPYVAHKMDLQANFFGYNPHLLNSRYLQNYLLKLNSTYVHYRHRRFASYQNILEEEVGTLKSFEDILIRCQSRGFKCGVDDFEVFPRYFRNYRICVIFKAKAFFKKMRTTNIEKRPESEDVFLSILLMNNWLKHPANLTTDSYLYYRKYQNNNIRIFLLESDTALFSTSRSTSETKLVPCEFTSKGKWKDITFSLAVKERIPSVCSPTSKRFEIVDDIINKTHKFSYFRELCQKIKVQQALKKYCGCYDILLPLESSVKNPTFCQTIPPSFHEARSCFVDVKNRTILWKNAEEKIIKETPFDAKVFKNILCAKKHRSYATLEEHCLQSCQAITAKVLQSSSKVLDREAIDEEFLNDTDDLTIPNDKIEELNVIKIRPSSWRIPLTKKVEVYPLSKLLSDLGGMSGMWLGASMVGLIELVIKLRRNIAKKKSKDLSNMADADPEMSKI